MKKSGFFFLIIKFANSTFFSNLRREDCLLIKIIMKNVYMKIFILIKFAGVTALFFSLELHREDKLLMITIMKIIHEIFILIKSVD